MSVSLRSTKTQMYAEIERLRELCDRQEQQLRARTSNKAIVLSIPSNLGHRAKHEVAKNLAAELRCMTRVRDGAIEAYHNGHWTAV